MAFGRLARSQHPPPMADINMTPLIDVMLVLLVIFMITAPLMTSSLKLDLPESQAAQPSNTPQFLVVAIDAEGHLFLGDAPIGQDALDTRLTQAAQANAKTEVQLRADRTVPYGRVAELIGLVQHAGLSRIAFVAQPQPTP